MYNEKYVDKYLIKPAEDGTRADTKLAVEHSDEAVAEFLANGYVLVGDDDFQKLIGNAGKPYSIAMDGTLYETPPYVPPLEEVQATKLSKLKSTRDTLETEPIEYNGNRYDYDDKARDRINAAIIALDVQTAQTKAVASIDWTTADNADVKVTADDLRCVIAMVAQRSNALHVAYRAAKDKVEAATTVAEVEAVTLNL
jgi:hypothetical protein|nr:MAG TPA: protein of unknown function (DUF4376) [Caudoviricetes sp.]